MLKGKSTIQLFDAKTGKEVKRVENENMITNAISNILNVPLDFTYYNGFKTIADTVLPIQTVGLAGLLIWDNTIPENADIVVPPANVREVGHAGDAYSGTNEYRGSYNSNESGEIDGGYRHVWDFGTDKANGEIKCLSLTSRSGGNCGYHYDSGGYNIRWIYGLCSKSSVYNSYLGRVAKNKYAFTPTTSGSTIKINYYNLFDSDKITLRETTGTELSECDTKTISVSNSFSTSYTRTRLTDRPSVYICSYSGTKVWYSEIDFSTGTLVHDNTVTLTIPSDYKQSISYLNGVNDDGIFVCLYNNNNTSYPYCIAKFTHNGDFVETVTGYNWSSVPKLSMFNIGDKWYIGDYGITVPFEKITINNSSYTKIQCYDYNNNYPLYLSIGASADYSQVALYLFNTYLGTINNLATPVTKTSAQTMKITYDLIQG